ncbi:hypothetical protein AB8A21_37870 [Streptomyces sp. BF23-18]|uniref:hypothetical protein n=1 Tax=Streptomyces sp. BF23-18 TaxID=3240282 RepID=UPI0034E38826
MKREGDSTQSARVRKARRAQGRMRSSGPQHPRLPARTPRGEEPSGSPDSFGGSSTGQREDDRLFRLAARLRYGLLAVAIAMLVWFLVSLGGEKTWGVELAAPTWPVDIAALTPLLALIPFWKPEARAAGVTTESDLKIFSGLYLFMSLPLAALDGRRQLWPAVLFSLAVYVGIWYTNRQARARG